MDDVFFECRASSTIDAVSSVLTLTTTQLLEDLADPANQAVWQLFDARYRPVLLAFARRLDLPAEDAADVAQEALTRFMTGLRDGRFDRDRGRLRSWMIGIARNCVFDLKRKQATRREQRGVSAVVELPDEATLGPIWDDACEQAILREAMTRLRQETRTDECTLAIFEMVAFEQRTVAATAEALGVTADEVYMAKHRCLKRLRVIVQELHEIWETTADEGRS